MKPRDTFGANPPGRLAAVMLRALTAELADPGRYSRARVYARDGAVVDIEVEPGIVRGVVQGSRPGAYEAMVFVTPLAPADLAQIATPASTAASIPGPEDLATSCSCPDGDEYASAVCKHALATLMVFADEVTMEPDLLLRWRSGTTVVPLRPGGRGSGRAASSSSATSNAVAIDVLAERLQARGQLPNLPQLAPPALAPVLADEFTDVLVSALAAVARPS